MDIIDIISGFLEHGFIIVVLLIVGCLFGGSLKKKWLIWLCVVPLILIALCFLTIFVAV